MAHGPVNNFLCGVVVVFFSISVTDCQLSFQAQQTLHGVGLLCSVGDLGSTNFSHLDSLLIFKSVAGKPKLIAFLSSHYGPNDPVSHLEDAQVTGHLSNEDTLGSYLRITWDHYQDDIDGDYICRLNGVDEVFTPLSLTEELSFQVKTMCPCFGTTPQVLRVGLTEQLEVTCYIPDPPAINISQLASLEIIMIRNGMKQILAEINSLTGTAIKDWPGVGFVNGSLGGSNTFLRLFLENPTAEMASEYICEGSGVGVSGDPVFFSRSVNVSLEVPNSKELIQRLFELYGVQKELTCCQEERDRLTTTKPVTSSTTTTITTPVTTAPTTTITTPVTTPTTTFSLTTTNPMFPRSCEDANLPVGQNVITIQPDDGLGTMDVLCEVVTPQEIWTLFQKRFDGSVSFYRSFNEYKNGFGSVHGEFWLGLDNTRRLLLQNNDNNQVKFDLIEDSTLIPYTKTYPVFSIGRGDDYILNISGGGIDREYYGISACIGQIFSTYDHGYTTVAGSGAGNRAAGWWFPTLGGYVNINGIWGLINPAKSMYWYEFRMSWYYPMTKTEIKFRRNN